jgi:hypothetical protein
MGTFFELIGIFLNESITHINHPAITLYCLSGLFMIHLHFIAYLMQNSTIKKKQISKFHTKHDEILSFLQNLRQL